MKVHRDVDGKGKIRFPVNAIAIASSSFFFIQEFHSYAQRILPQASKQGGDANADTLLQPLVRTQIVFKCFFHNNKN